jgi:hypothetical protein
MIIEARRAGARRGISTYAMLTAPRHAQARRARTESEQTQRHPWDPSRVRASQTNPSAHYPMDLNKLLDQAISHDEL